MINEKVNRFLNTPAGKIITVGTVCTALVGCIQFLKITCTGINDVNAAMCVTRKKVVRVSDSVAKVRDDSVKTDIGEVLADMSIENMRTQHMVRQLTPVSRRTRSPSGFASDSARMMRYFKSKGLKK